MTLNSYCRFSRQDVYSGYKALLTYFMKPWIGFIHKITSMCGKLHNFFIICELALYVTLKLNWPQRNFGIWSGFKGTVAILNSTVFANSNFNSSSRTELEFKEHFKFNSKLKHKSIPGPVIRRKPAHKYVIMGSDNFRDPTHVCYSLKYQSRA